MERNLNPGEELGYPFFVCILMVENRQVAGSLDFGLVFFRQAGKQDVFHLVPLVECHAPPRYEVIPQAGFFDVVVTPGNLPIPP
jgi:hypothetical protein